MMAKTYHLDGCSNLPSFSPSTTADLLSVDKDILKPQLKFREKVNNNGVFMPKIKEKPHALEPLAVTLLANKLGEKEFSHPYAYELGRFTPDPKFLICQSTVPTFKKTDEVPLVMVDNEESFKLLVKDLSEKTVVGVDLEAHSHRSFQGITCLMQISTDDTDYIVDTLELWDKLQALNQVFCNPGIVKVFHGSDNDILWLQRDFGLYVVNMFDTQQAAKSLAFSKLSFAFLLQHYCSVDADKQYQRADWRIRPLPQEMLTYAREDTHYLEYIFERMKQDLKTKANNSDDLLTGVWKNSQLTCLKRYRIPQFARDSHLKLYNRSKKSFNKQQLYALKELVIWRDRVAREEDDSLHFVLPAKMMLEIASQLPQESQGIIAACSPVPPLVRKHVLQLLEIIRKATVAPQSSLNHPVTGANGVQHVKDLASTQNTRNDLPTLLTSPNPEEPSTPVEKVAKTQDLQAQTDVFEPCNEEQPSIAVEKVKKAQPLQSQVGVIVPAFKAGTSSDTTLEARLTETLLPHTSSESESISKKRKRENEEEEREERNTSAPGSPT